MRWCFFYWRAEQAQVKTREGILASSLPSLQSTLFSRRWRSSQVWLLFCFHCLFHCLDFPFIIIDWHTCWLLNSDSLTNTRKRSSWFSSLFGFPLLVITCESRRNKHEIKIQDDQRVSCRSSFSLLIISRWLSISSQCNSQWQFFIIVWQQQQPRQ